MTSYGPDLAHCVFLIKFYWNTSFIHALSKAVFALYQDHVACKTNILTIQPFAEKVW